MAKIGSFKKVSGEFRGRIITLSVQAKSVRIAAETDVVDNGPSHRVFIDEFEIGAAWSKKTKDKRSYLAVKLDDPSFVAPVFARLFEGDDGEFELVWTRQSRRDYD